MAGVGHRTGALTLIGDTPLVRLTKGIPDGSAEVWAKVESRNPTGSVKDRAALAMIEAAEAEGIIGPGAMVVEPTSGNTGIALAMICAVRGYTCKLVMPDDMSEGRQLLMRAFGANVVLSRADDGMLGAVEKAEALVAASDNAFMPQQFENPANPATHERTTGPELVASLGGKVPDAFVAGVGTGGTLTGVGRHLRSLSNEVRIIAVEPKRSRVLSGGQPGLHGIQGLGAGFIPPVLEVDLLSDVIPVSDPDALNTASALGHQEGILCGPSSGANVWAATQVAKTLGEGHVVVTVICDGGERYL